METTPRYYDISPEISEKIAVFPGDTPYRRRVLMEFKKGDNLVLSALEFSPHIGAHADAPSHYSEKGGGISSRNLDYYWGPCQVISVHLSRGQRIRSQDIARTPIKAPRVLFKTLSFPNPEKWNDDFNSLSADLVQYLAEKEAKLVGIDTPSIDPVDDKILEAHRAIAQKNMAILEGIVLDGVPDGLYTLIALPLKIKDCDASPVRAVLLDGGHS